MVRIRIALLLTAVACAASAGCLGGPGNPRTFPYYLPPGDIIRTHGKPAGTGYFKDFDPQAVRLEVTPTQCSVSTKNQQVLIASVYDKDGDLRRKRRVEWMIDGPGFIVEVDESGIAPGRGYKVDNKYAVSYTDHLEHTITRGNDDPRDDFTIRPGQTWCVVSSAVEGLTTVTAYAPEIHDWDKGRVTARLAWSDSQFGFPPPVISRSGTEAELSTTVHRFEGKDSAAGLKVRYKVLDGGAPAMLVGKSGSGTTVTASGTGQRETEVATGSDGLAAVRVIPSSGQGGKTRIAVEVLKPDGTVIGTQETSVEWSSAQLALNVEAPKSAAIDRDAAILLTVSNTGKADSQAVTVKATVPDGAEFISADPPPTNRQGRELSWALGSIPAASKQTITLTLKSSRKGSLDLAASATTADGLRADHRANVAVDTAGLKVTFAATPTVAVGEKASVKLTVANTGAVPAENVTAWIGFDPGLEHPTGENPVERNVGDIPPGESKTLDLPLTASRPGKFIVRVNATGDGGLASRSETTIEARKQGLFVNIVGPEKLAIGEESTFQITVSNPGEVAFERADVRAALPAGLSVKSASPNGQPEGETAAVWRLGAMKPQGKETLRLVVVANKSFERKNLSITANATSGTGSPMTAAADAPVEVSGAPALVLELADPPGVVQVGRSGALRITVRNRGTGTAKRVEVSVSASDEMTLLGGTGADRKQASTDGKRIVFGIIDELPAGAVAVYLADLEASKPGSARIQVELRAEHLAKPNREEIAARVVIGN